MSLKDRSREKVIASDNAVNDGLIITLRNGTGNRSRIGFAVKVSSDDDDYFEYAGVGDSPIGIVQEEVGANGYARIATGGRGQIYVKGLVKQGGLIRNQLAGDAVPPGTGLPYNNEDGCIILGRSIQRLKDGLANSHITIGGSFSADQEFTLPNTQWDDLRVPISSTRVGTAAPPDFEMFRRNSGGTSEGVYAYAFDKTTEQELFFTVQIPHGYKLGTDLYPHVHYAIDNAAGGTVIWGLEYTIANVNDAFPVTTTIYTTSDSPTVTYKHTIVSFTAPIDGSAIDSVSTMLLCRIFRDVSNDTFNDDVFLLELDFHIQLDQIGSDGIYTK